MMAAGLRSVMRESLLQCAVSFAWRTSTRARYWSSHLHPRHQHRQQDEVGEDHDGHANAGGHRHFLHHLHGDQQDGDETDQVGQQRDDGRHQQLPEGLARGAHAVDACDRGLLDGADLLHAMRHANGEDQEGNEESQRIDAVTEQHQRAELPRHRHEGAHDGHHRDLQRLHVVPDGEQREQDRDHREHDDGHRAIRDVANHLGETDHVHVDARSLRLHQHLDALDLVAHAAFEIARDFDGVDEFAGGVLLQHDGRHQRARKIVGHQAAADAGFQDVFPDLRQCFGRGHELGIDHIAGLDAVLDHFHVTHVGREQGLHSPTIDAVHDQHFVGGFLESVEESRREHVAVARDERHQHAVRAAELGLVFHEGLHVLVLERQLLGERGIDVQTARRHEAQGQRQEREHHHDEKAVAEDQPFERRLELRFAGSFADDHS